MIALAAGIWLMASLLLVARLWPDFSRLRPIFALTAYGAAGIIAYFGIAALGARIAGIRLLPQRRRTATQEANPGSSG
jgi:hypothetical protein